MRIFKFKAVSEAVDKAALVKQIEALLKEKFASKPGVYVEVLPNLETGEIRVKFGDYFDKVYRVEVKDVKIFTLSTNNNINPRIIEGRRGYAKDFVNYSADLIDADLNIK